MNFKLSNISGNSVYIKNSFVTKKVTPQSDFKLVDIKIAVRSLQNIYLVSILSFWTKTNWIKYVF